MKHSLENDPREKHLVEVLRRSFAGSNRYVHLTDEGMSLRGVRFRTTPPFACAVQPMDVRAAAHPRSPARLRSPDLRHLPLSRTSIVDCRTIGPARRDHGRPRASLRKWTAPSATSAPRAKSLKPACPLGTVPGRERGRGGPWSRFRRNSSRALRGRPSPFACTSSG